MIDLGFDKLALIGAVALLAIGPERLPKVARTVGHLVGKAQRYVADVKSEVNRSIEQDELKKMRAQVEEAGRDVEAAMRQAVDQTVDELQNAVTTPCSESAVESTTPPMQAPVINWHQTPRKNWRLKRNVLHLWYKQRHGVRVSAYAGAACRSRHRGQPLE